MCSCCPKSNIKTQTEQYIYFLTKPPDGETVFLINKAVSNALETLNFMTSLNDGTFRHWPGCQRAYWQWILYLRPTWLSLKVNVAPTLCLIALKPFLPVMSPCAVFYCLHLFQSINDAHVATISSEGRLARLKLVARFWINLISGSISATLWGYKTLAEDNVLPCWTHRKNLDDLICMCCNYTHDGIKCECVSVEYSNVSLIRVFVSLKPSSVFAEKRCTVSLNSRALTWEEGHQHALTRV